MKLLGQGIMTLVVLLAVTALLPGPVGAQGVDADLELVGVEIENATFDAREPANVTVTITNHGPGSASGVLHYRYDTTDRTLTGDARSDQPFNTTDPIDPGETVHIPFPWRPQEDQIGSGTIIVQLTSPSDDTPENNRNQTSVFVKHYAVSASVTDPSDRVTLPGRVTGVSVDVENVGNAPLNLSTVVEGTQPPGWEASARDGSPHIGVGDSAQLALLVRPPDQGEDALPDGTRVSVPLRLAAQENPQANTTIQLPNVTVDRDPESGYEFGVELDPNQEEVAVFPGAPTTLEVHVRNTGSVFDVFNITTQAQGALAENLTIRSNRTVIVLGPEEQKTHTFEIEPRGSPEAGQSSTLTVLVESLSADVFAPNARNQSDVTVRMAAPDPAAQSLQLPDAVYQRQGTLPVRAVIENVGEGPAPPTNATLSAIRGGFVFASTSLEIPVIQPGEQQEMVFALAIEELSGRYDLSLEIDPDGTLQEASRANNLVRSEVFVRTAGLHVTPANPLEALPGQFVRYEQPPHVFQVRNLGNAQEVALVQVRSGNGWIDVEQRIDLPPGARRPVPVSFFVPDAPGTEVDQLTVSAQLINLTEVRAFNASETRIVDNQAPEPVVVEIPGNVTATIPFHVHTEWFDAVGVDHVELRVVSPSNGTETVQLEQVNRTIFEGAVTVFEIGEHELILVAEDEASQPNRFEADAPVRVTSTYNRTPEIHIPASVGQTPVRAGTPIPVNVTDPAGVTSVRYEGAGQEGPLNRPFQVPTDNWPEGPHELIIRASNRFDLSSTANVTVLVDNTPPTIRSVTLDPASPRAGQTTTVTVETDGDGATGTLIVDPGRDQEQTIEMSARSGGVLQATFVPEADQHELLIQIHDAAGNEATSDRTVHVGERGIPVPWLAPILASTLAAVLTHRARAGRTTDTGP